MSRQVKRPSTLKQVVLACGALATVVFTAQQVKPVYAGRAPVVRQLLAAEAERDSARARAPWAQLPGETAMMTPQFEIDRRAFMEDLLRTGRVTPPRADSLATIAVRESYRRRVPPALVFGVMMVENAQLKSSARSSIGAIGLMQINPRAWVRSLGKHFGTNLRNDETNLRYGVYILSHLVYDSAEDLPATDSMSVHGSLRRGLLRYNGCVRGTNTRNCHRYPDVVRRRIETLALSQCGVGGYNECVAEPLKYAMDD